jgi:hypothetical protein
MSGSEFLFDCIVAIIIVFFILAILSILIHLLTKFLPDKSTDDDSVLLAAVSSHINRIYPQSRISKIEELK